MALTCNEVWHTCPERPLPADLVYVRSAALAWSAGDRLSLRVDGAVLVTEPIVDAVPDALMVVRTGFVRLPYRWRRRVNLFLGDRVLLLANPSRN
ncbi:hypothetical protein GCM10027262_60640 [Nocardia tengchongensis]